MELFCLPLPSKLDDEYRLRYDCLGCNDNQEDTAMHKQPYICYALTELPEATRDNAKRFYEAVGGVCTEVLGAEAFIPHQNYDPVKHAHFTPAEVDRAERAQVCTLTSVLVVVALAPSWGGGIEVEMAYRSNVPIIILRRKNEKLSRLLLGNPGVKDVIWYDNEVDALAKLKTALEQLFEIAPVAAAG